MNPLRRMWKRNNKVAELVYLRFIAMLMLMLTLSLPFFSAGVAAAGQIHSVSAQGQDGLEGIVRQTDQITVRADASMDNREVTPADIRLGSNPFASCTSSVQGQTCTLRIPDQGTTSFTPRSIPYTVVLKGDLDQTLDSESSAVVVDNRAPTVELTDVSPELATTGSVTFSYSVEDTACQDSSCANACSGIDRVEFFTADNSFSETVDVDSADCTLDSTLVKQTTAFNNGDQSLLARAYDRFGQASAVDSIDFSVDRSGPTFHGDTLRVYRQGEDLSHFKPNSPLSVTVQISVEDDALDTSTVRADLSALNPSDNTLTDRLGSCTVSSGDSYTCTWSLTLNMNQQGAKQLTFSASDTNNNKAQTTFTRSFTVDATGPRVTSLSASGASTNSGAFAGSTATIIAQVTEAGVGVSAQQMFLSVGGQKIPANSCGSSSCTWENVNMGSGDVDVSFDTSSTDLLGNSGQSFTRTFTVNANAPTVRTLDVLGVGGLNGLTQEFITIGDRIAIEANVSEDTQISNAVADLSDFISGATAVSGSCQYQQGNDFICTWLSDPVERAETGTAEITITDAAGNAVTESRSVQTFERDDEQSPNYWTVDHNCAPSVLDRQVGTLVEQRSYCTMTMVPRSQGQQLSTVGVELVGCTGDQDSLLRNVELFNGESGSTEPMLKVTLRRNELNIDQLKTTCTLNIFSRVDGAITQNPEEEQVQIDLRFANQPLGEVSDQVQQKIEDAQAATEGIWSLIGTLQDIIVIAKKICQVLGALYNIVQFGTTLAIELGITSTQTCATDWFLFKVSCAATTQASTEWCVAQQNNQQATGEAYSEYINKFCSFVNCRWAPWVLGDVQDWTREQLDSLPGSDYVPGGFGSTIKPDSSLVSSIFFACIPGVVKHLDSYRQIQCLYADCIQRAVVEDNVPLQACEDLKAQATCKYVMGEVFAVIPYTALFDQLTGMLKSALSDPFSVIGLAVGAYCYGPCANIGLDYSASYTACQTADMVSKVGEVIRDITSIIDEGLFENRYDYCEQVEDFQNQGSEGEDDGSWF